MSRRPVRIAFRSGMNTSLGFRVTCLAAPALRARHFNRTMATVCAAEHATTRARRAHRASAAVPGCEQSLS